MRNLRERRTKQQEKEALKREILSEIEREKLKTEIINELKPADRRTKLWGFVQHPAFLLLLGALIGTIGTSFTTYYTASKQAEEWNRQQIRLAKTRNAEEKYKVIDELVKSIVESDAANRGVIYELIWLDNNRIPNKEIEEKSFEQSVKNWQQKSSDWIVDSSKFEQRLKIYFGNSDISTMFEELSSKRASADVELRFFLMLYSEKKEALKSKQFDNLITKAGKTAQEINDTLKKLVEIMTNEVQRDLFS